MTNYNDGKWHGWNGGECPVHPMTIVAAIYGGETPDVPETRLDGVIRLAGQFQSSCWNHDEIISIRSKIIAFRVVKEHREPREFWVCESPDHRRPVVFASEAEMKAASWVPGLDQITHVREVLE